MKYKLKENFVITRNDAKMKLTTGKKDAKGYCEVRCKSPEIAEEVIARMEDQGNLSLNDGDIKEEVTTMYIVEFEGKNDDKLKQAFTAVKDPEAYNKPGLAVRVSKADQKRIEKAKKQLEEAMAILKEAGELEVKEKVKVKKEEVKVKEVEKEKEEAVSEICIACEGSGLNSKGKKCPICKGKGFKEVEEVEDPEVDEVEDDDTWPGDFDED